MRVRGSGRVGIVVAAVLALVSGALSTEPAVAAPVASVSPDTGLRDGQQVRVTIAGDTPAAFRVVVACVAGATEMTDCDVTDIGYVDLDATGGGTLDWTLAAVLYPSDGGRVDCRTAACQLVVADGSSSTFAAPMRLPLAFDPGAPLLPPPTAVATPSDGLVDGQTITVTGSGFRRGYPVLSQCDVRAGGVGECDPASTTFPEVVDGAFTTSFVVFSALDLPDGQLDCRPTGTCALAVSMSYEPSRADTIAIPLGFDADGPLPPVPEATVTPSTGLRDGQVVNVSGSGFRPTAFVSAIQCASGDAGALCDYDTATAVAVAPDGTFSLSYAVSALLVASGTSEAVDCRMAACVLQVAVDSGESIAIVLAFDPDAPTLPLPTISIEPTAGLIDGQSVGVVGDGFRPGVGVSIRQCVAGDGACDTSDSFVSVDADGHLDAAVPVWADIIDHEGATHPCDVAPGCVLVVQAPRLGQVGVPLAFGPRPPSRGRYFDTVFDEIEVERDIVYRSAVNSRGNVVDLKIDVYQPVGDVAPVRPAIVWFHGGYFAFGDKTNMDGYARAFARRGYVAASVQYRLRPEIGSSIDERTGAALIDAYHDADASIAWLRAHSDEYRIDPKAIAAGGYSAGAVNSMNLAYLPGQLGPDASRIAAAVSIAGLTVGTPEKGEPPSLVLHGLDDTVVPYALGRRSCDSVNAAKVDCERVDYPGAGHEIFGTRERDIVRRTADFLGAKVLEPLGFLRPTPSAHAGGPYAVVEGSKVRLDGTGSRAASGGTLQSSWTPADRLRDPKTAWPTFVGLDDGIQSVVLAVREGRVGASATATVTTTNAPPTFDVATLGKVQGQKRRYSFTGRVLDAGLDDTHAALVDWGDGQRVFASVTQRRGRASLRATHTYGRAGAFTVQVLSIDDDGGMAIVSRRVTVS